MIDHKWPGCFQSISAPIGRSGFWWPALKLPLMGTSIGFQNAFARWRSRAVNVKSTNQSLVFRKPGWNSINVICSEHCWYSKCNLFQFNTCIFWERISNRSHNYGTPSQSDKPKRWPIRDGESIENPTWVEQTNNNFHPDFTNFTLYDLKISTLYAHAKKYSNPCLISCSIFSLWGLWLSSFVSGIGNPPRWHLQMTSLWWV